MPAAQSSLANDPELLSDFVFEAREHLGTIESRLLTLEQAPADPEAVHDIFRAFHSIKGIGGFLESAEIVHVAHEVETILGMARDGRLAITPAVIDRILDSKDFLATCISEIEPSPGAGTVAASQNADDRLVKVRTAKLDHLIELVGELVTAQSRICTDPGLSLDNGNVAQLTRITREVQKTALSMRMAPIGQTFRKLTRLVRDVSHQSGKYVRLELVGEDTELDRSIVDQLADPVMHMVRNAVDHGIETPSERESAGKPALARLSLKASHQDGQAVIQVSDDGRGLDRGKILAKAGANGLIGSAEGLSDSEIFNLIFQPGFSTAEKVTDLSGRGVGMDIVRRSIQKLRGKVEIESEAGLGTTFRITVPDARLPLYNCPCRKS